MQRDSNVQTFGNRTLELSFQRRFVLTNVGAEDASA
jgi:hypothetical protein